jgi:hypothetical protein
MKFIPVPTPDGGSLIGNSYTAKYASCPLAWFNSFYRPFEGSRGIKPQFVSEHLTGGSTFHQGIAALYTSGCRDGKDTGEWDLDLAISILRLAHLQNTVKYESEEKAEEHGILFETMLIAYHDERCKGGPKQDWPTIRIEHDDKGEPLIERDFSIDLGYKDFVFTCRPDAIITHHTFPKVFEHKTSAPGFWSDKRLASIHTDSQFTGECFVLASVFPDVQVDGVLCNIVIKGGKSKITKRDTTRRSPWDLTVFRLSILDILQQIDHRTEGFENDLDSGYPIEEAVQRWFPDHGTRTGACENYGGCEFQRLCLNKNRIEQNLKCFRPRTVGEVKAEKEKVK